MKLISLVRNGKRIDVTKAQLEEALVELNEAKVEKKDIDNEGAR